eukprot:49402-Amorphochlora_amoeboformis.AAC.1
MRVLLYARGRFHLKISQPRYFQESRIFLDIPGTPSEIQKRTVEPSNLAQRHARSLATTARLRSCCPLIGCSHFLAHGKSVGQCARGVLYTPKLVGYPRAAAGNHGSAVAVGLCGD